MKKREIITATELMGHKSQTSRPDKQHLSYCACRSCHYNIDDKEFIGEVKPLNWTTRSDTKVWLKVTTVTTA